MNAKKEQETNRIKTLTAFTTCLADQQSASGLVISMALDFDFCDSYILPSPYGDFSAHLSPPSCPASPITSGSMLPNISLPSFYGTSSP
jgi:hypothetical protein